MQDNTKGSSKKNNSVEDDIRSNKEVSLKKVRTLESDILEAKKADPMTLPKPVDSNTKSNIKEKRGDTSLSFFEKATAISHKSFRNKEPKIPAPLKKGASQPETKLPEATNIEPPKVAKVAKPEASTKVAPQKISPQPKVEKPLEDRLSDVEQSLQKKENELSSLRSEEEPLKQSIRVLDGEKTQIERALSPIIEEEENVETIIRLAEEKERKATTESEKQSAEKERWPHEETRKEIEKRKWEIEEKLDTVLNKIIGVKTQLAKIEKEKTQKEIEQKNLQLEHKILGLKLELRELSKKKETLELEWVGLNGEKERVENKLAPIKEGEQAFEIRKAALEKKEHSATSHSEEHSAEEARWRVEEDLRKIEQERWEASNELNSILKKVEDLKPIYQDALAKEESVVQALAELESQHKIT